MELMLTIVHDFLKKNEKATFIQIFSEIKSILKDKWKIKFSDKTTMEIEAKKKGELFGYLNTDGRFVKISDKHWALTHNYSFEEIKKLRISIDENKE